MTEGVEEEVVETIEATRNRQNADQEVLPQTPEVPSHLHPAPDQDRDQGTGAEIDIGTGLNKYKMSQSL